MQRLIIKGGKKLEGEVYVSGAKNSALPILAATLLSGGSYDISNVPNLKDIETMSELLANLGVYIEKKEEHVSSAINSSSRVFTFTNTLSESSLAPYDLVKTMRAGILVLGPLLASKGHAIVSLPGGCAIGERPVDLHISALEKMGATITIDKGYINAKASKLKGVEINFKLVTVTGTENIMMAATLAEGTTVLNNAAQEPEVVDLAKFLTKMGAKITGAGTSRIVIEGVSSLSASNYTIMSDRIEAATLLCAVAGSKGKAKIYNAPIDSMDAVLTILTKMGVKLILDKQNKIIYVESNARLQSVDITTTPYPGFPTDMQAQIMALMTEASGVSVVNETIFENRFMHVAELKRMGADINILNGCAIIKGVNRLSGAPIMASDLRGSASLVIGSLMAEGTSELSRLYHLDRGYERLDSKLISLGADIVRV